MKKNNSHLLAITILFLLPILLVGCNKNTVQGGAEIGYPYSCSISGNGTVTVKLDGSASPDYTWYASSDDVAVVTVSKKGMETNGKATFKITPVSEGDTSVTFIRERETTATTDLYEYATSEELASYEAEISGTTKDAVATVMEPESEPESDENNQSETAVADSTESTGSAGYTTSDVLKKAAKAADKQYWIVYYRYNKLKMSSFNALEDFTVTLANNCLNCDKTVGDPTIYYWDDDKNDFTESIRDPWFCDEIIGGNCDVVDEKNDKTIKARTK